MISSKLPTRTSFIGFLPFRAFSKVPFSLPPLPYDLKALEPHISKETLEYHHGKHHQT
jgi:hypothetical protein